MIKRRLLLLSLLLISHSAFSENMDHEMAGTDDMLMKGVLGSYSMMREASGTSWQPESTPHNALFWELGDWSMMTHGFLNVIYDHQGGNRGDDKSFTASMIMLQGSRDLDKGTLNFKSMFSLDPLMGKSGYPLLFQTGETADGVTHLTDKQHPHNFIVELAGSYSIPVSEKNSVFVYGGIVGEPALGPTVFMHRLSGMDNPEAPISHHWLDSTHITNGVVTFGYTNSYFKVETSSFHGREPDQYRYRIETGELDSYSARVTINPNEDISMQLSAGHLHSPESLKSNINVNRITSSITFNKTIYGGLSQTTLAFGKNNPSEGVSTNAYLLESSWAWTENNTAFMRAEKVDKNELFDETNPLANKNFNVKKLSVGMVHDFPTKSSYTFGLGAVGSIYNYSSSLDSVYGSDPKSLMVFLRLKI